MEFKKELITIGKSYDDSFGYEKEDYNIKLWVSCESLIEWLELSNIEALDDFIKEYNKEVDKIK